MDNTTQEHRKRKSRLVPRSHESLALPDYRDWYGLCGVVIFRAKLTTVDFLVCIWINTALPEVHYFLHNRLQTNYVVVKR